MKSLSLREKEKDRQSLGLLLIRLQDPQIDWDTFWSRNETGVSTYAEDFLRNIKTAPYSKLFEVRLIVCGLRHSYKQNV